MSEDVYYRGKVKLLERNLEETLEEQCKRIFNQELKKSYHETYADALLEEHYDEYIIYDGNLYSIGDLEDVDIYDELFKSKRIDDKNIGFEVKYYNGGCSLTEAIHQALDNLKEDNYEV